MSFFNKLFPQIAKLSQDQLQVNVLLKNLSLDELEHVCKKYISRDPKVQYTDSDGIVKTRKPNRQDLINSIVKNVTLDGVLKVFPELKNKL